MNVDTMGRWAWPDLRGHAVAGVQDGFVVVLGALVQTVAAGFAVPHLKDSKDKL